MMDEYVLTSVYCGFLGPGVTVLGTLFQMGTYD